MKKPITWGSYKGERGYWEWHRGHVRFVSAEKAERKASGLQIVKDIEPFVNVAIDGAVIGGRRQKRDMMRAHNLIEVGNEKPMPHPRDIADQRRNRADPAIVERLKANSGGKWL